MGRLRHPHPSLPLKGEGIEGRGQGVALFMRRSVTTNALSSAALRQEFLIAPLGLSDGYAKPGNGKRRPALDNGN